MVYVIMVILGAAGGAVCTYFLSEQKWQSIRQHEQELNSRADSLAQEKAALRTESQALQENRNNLAREYAEVSRSVVSYRELQAENGILKRDLRNLDIQLRKLELDTLNSRDSQESIDERSRKLAERYLKDTVKWVGSGLTTSNFVNSKQKIQKCIEWCRSIGYDIPQEQEQAILADLKAEYEKLVRVALQREEQARIKARLRDEQLRQREIDRELERLDRERTAIEVALQKALAEAKDQHSVEIENLRARLAEAQEKAERTKSQAQLTKAGHVYVISNLGSFGEDVFKIGMTRRLEPQDRVRELGDASVPFPFDVHMMISCEDAPSLETALHHELHQHRINKLNPRREFFKIDLETVRGIVEEHHGKVEYTADAEALEYRQSLIASDEDEEFIEEAYEKAGVSDEEGIED